MKKKEKTYKFIIVRASLDWRTNGDKVKPCKEAKFFRFSKTVSGQLFKRWMIEFRGLKELLDFVDKYGAIIIDEVVPPVEDIRHKIIIYDDYIFLRIEKNDKATCTPSKTI